MDYKAILVLNIYNKSRTKCTSGSKEVEFPFAPYDGLQIADKKTMFTYKLNSVTWLMDEQCFRCLIEDQEVDNIDLAPIDMNFLVSQARASGWVGFEKVMQL